VAAEDGEGFVVVVAVAVVEGEQDGGVGGGLAAVGQVDGFGEVDDAVALLEVGDLPVELGGGGGEGAGVVGGLFGVADAVVVEDEKGRRRGKGLDQASGSGEFAGAGEECFFALDERLPGYVRILSGGDVWG